MTTNDFYLASFLVASGIKLQGHKRIDDKTKFYFEDCPKTDFTVNQYYSMNGSVEPITYANAIKGLKSVIHSYANININHEVNHHVKQTSGTK